MTVHIPHTVYDFARQKTWTAGKHQLNDAQALLYVRQRRGLPGGGFDRVKRQQNLLRLLMQRTMVSGLGSHPVRSYQIIDAVTKNLTVDSDCSTRQMARLAQQLGKSSQSDFYFTTASVPGTGRVGAQGVVFHDKPAAHGSLRALNPDLAPSWFRARPESELNGTVTEMTCDVAARPSSSGAGAWLPFRPELPLGGRALGLGDMPSDAQAVCTIRLPGTQTRLVRRVGAAGGDQLALFANPTAVS